MDVVTRITNLVFPMAIVALFFNFFGIIAFYSFKKQRRFPASLLAWIAGFNILWGIYMLVKWSPGSKSHVETVLELSPSSKLCQFIIFFDNFLFYSSVGTNTLIALTLFLCVYKDVNMEYKNNPKFFWSYVVALLIWVTVIPLAMAFQPRGELLDIACGPSGLIVIGIEVPCYVLIGVQTCLIIPAFSRTNRIINSIRTPGRTNRDIRVSLLYLRYILTFFSQLIYFLPHNTLVLRTQATGDPASLDVTIFTTTCYCLGMILDGMILTFTNRELWIWIKSVVTRTAITTSDESELKRRRTLSSVDKPSLSPEKLSELKV